MKSIPLIDASNVPQIGTMNSIFLLDVVVKKLRSISTSVHVIFGWCARRHVEVWRGHTVWEVTVFPFKGVNK